MHLSRALSLFLSLAVPAVCQTPEPAVDIKQVRKEAQAAFEAGDFAAAAAAFQKVTVANPKDGEAWHRLGYSLHVTGKLDEALPAHLKAAEFPAQAAVGSYNVACVHALKGRTDEAFTWLEKAIGAGFRDAELLATDSDLDSLRTDARFKKLEQALKAKAKGPAGVQAFAQTTERRSARVAWFGRAGSPGQLAIDYQPIPWNAKYDQALASGEYQGKKWRLGANFWTSLDTSIPLQFGAVEVPAGYYYLTLEQRDEKTFVLALHDAAAVKKLKLDAFQAEKLQGGIEVPMSHAVSDEEAKQLAIAVTPDKGSIESGALNIRFGGHVLSAAVGMKVQ
ncbi:MAG TPA: tetratricopeptide repeat protein [Planctomycetota bacterium]|nr:tetratricopeptide repeat protein [Planctomycetota bacterium]